MRLDDDLCSSLKLLAGWCFVLAGVGICSKTAYLPAAVFQVLLSMCATWQLKACGCCCIYDGVFWTATVAAQVAVDFLRVSKLNHWMLICLQFWTCCVGSNISIGWCFPNVVCTFKKIAVCFELQHVVWFLFRIDSPSAHCNATNEMLLYHWDLYVFNNANNGIDYMPGINFAVHVVESTWCPEWLTARNLCTGTFIGLVVWSTYVTHTCVTHVTFINHMSRVYTKHYVCISVRLFI